MKNGVWWSWMAGTLLLVSGCSDGGEGGAIEVPETFEFAREGASTVAYTGQVTRQLLISDLIGLMRSISDDVLGGVDLDRYDTSEEVFALLTPLYEQGAAADPSRLLPSLLDSGDTASQSTYSDLNDSNLKDKLAGNDASTDHADWNGGDFVGWESANLVVDGDGGLGAPETPETLLLGFLRTFAEQVASAANGAFPIDTATPLYLTPEGHDLIQLVQKFLLGAVNFSQGADDYLDDDVPDKGLLAANELDGEENYTPLEHHWDEAYGYFGAARDYGMYTDDELAGADGRPEYASGYFDTNGDGLIDYQSEYNFGASVNAAKRDRGSAEGAETDFTGQADLAWRTGRAIIAAAYEANEPVDMDALGAQRDIAVAVWERAIAATAVHYINDVLGDMDSIGTAEYSFDDHAKHWSELKGFALSFQFNPRSDMSATDFAAVHAAIGDAPVGASAASPVDDEDYRAQLLQARTLIGDAYGFDEANLLVW